MNNQRVNILLDELTQRYQEIADFKVAETNWREYKEQTKDFVQRVSEFVFFIRSAPELRSEFDKLIIWHDSQIGSTEVRRLLEKAQALIIAIGNDLIKSSEYQQLSVGQAFKEQNWKNPFDEFSGKPSTANEFIASLTENHDLSVEPIQKIDTVIGVLRGDEFPQNGILHRFGDLGDGIRTIVRSKLSELSKIVDQLRVHLEFGSHFVGHEEAKELQRVFAIAYPDKSEFNNFIQQFRDGRILRLHDLQEGYSMETFLHIQQAARRIFRILSRSFSASRTRNHCVFHLKAYMEWLFNRKGETMLRLPHENKLSEEMARFLFAQGFFPFIRFKIGGKEPDFYAISPHEELLIEVKKYSGEKKPSAQSLQSDINQAIDYHSVVKSGMQGIGIQHIDNEVFLVLFYNGNYRLRIEPDGIHQSDVFISIVPVYLGSKTPSQQRPEHRLHLTT
jgi:hypothetical protein